MTQHMSKEEYERKLSKLHEELSEIDKELAQNGIDLHQTEKTVESIEYAKSIINSIKETADIVNNTVSPMEFFDGYDKLYYLVNKLESVPDVMYTQQPPEEIRMELQGQRKSAIRNMIGRYYNHVISMNGSIDVFYNTISRYFFYMDNDHKNYVNQLCKVQKKEVDITKKIRKFKDFYMNFSYIINRILLPPAKVMFILWTFSWIFSLPVDKETSFGQKIVIVLFGYFIMCGIADLIYFQNKKKYNKYMIKITERKLKRLEKSLKEIDPVRYQNDFGNKTESHNQKTSAIKYDYMEGHEFEYFCADILRKNGFKNVEVTQGSGDQGIDIIAFKDGIKYGIQCKCYSNDIGNKAVQEAFSGKSFYNCHVGVVLTNRYFTASAKELAEKNGILLWDRDKLEEMVGRG